MPKRRPLHEMTRDLVAVVMGRHPADLVIRDGRWVNVHSTEILDHTDVAVLESRIAYCGPDAGPMIGPATKVIEAEGRYLVPGLLDAHVHIESSMLTVTQFARAVLPHGTTGAFVDPHEIANVLGLPGVRLMAEEAVRTPLQVYVQVPSCVPAAPGLETAGAEIGPAEVAEAMAWPGVIGLGEVMNYPGLAAGDEKVHEEIAVALKAGKAVGGHYASPDLGRGFHAYAAGGPSDCHEGTRPEDVVARVRQGMWAMVRQGSAWQDLAAQLRAVTELGIAARHVLLCTDDRHAGTLLSQGHMDDVVRLAIAQGIPPVTALQMATLNTAEHFGVASDVGSITPGRYADILLVSDLVAFTVDLVIAAGEVVAEAGCLTIELSSYPYPIEARNAVHLKRPLAPSDFLVEAPCAEGTVTVRAIEVMENQAPNRAIRLDLPVRGGRVFLDPDRDVALVAVVERHRGSGRIGHGFVTGLGLRASCAVASTVAHDSHNLLVLGTDPDAMAAAANKLAEIGGGVCVVLDRKVRALLPLLIVGLMSDRPVEIVAEEVEEVHRALRECGCTLNNAFMTISLLSLPVIPTLRVTDRGLVDVESASIVPLFL
ncbi:MAG: adenine deaminase [Candidatus Bipolaricaulota bacterium]